LVLASVFVAQRAAAQNAQFLPNTTIVAGSATKATNDMYTGDGGPALSASLAAGAEAVTMDAYGNIYVADTADNAIRRVDATTGIITTVAGLAPGATICSGAKDAIGDGCPATQASLNAPASVRIFRGDLYIADTTNNYIRRVSATTGIISVFAGNGNGTPVQTGTGPGAATATALSLPTDIVFDDAGDAYTVTANGKPYLLRIDGTTGNVTIVAGNGVAGNTGDGGAATAAEIQTPTGLALDAQGNLYFSGSTPNTVRKITLATGIITTYVGPSGGGAAGFGGDGGPANLAILNTPQHIAIDVLGNMYIADQKNQRLRMVTPPAAGALYGTITTIAGTGTASNSASGIASVNSNLNQVRGVDVTPAGDLVITDGFNAEVKTIAPPVNAAATAVGATTNYTASAEVLTSLTPKTFGVPAGYTSFSSGTVTGCAAGTGAAVGAICTVPLSFAPKSVGVQGAPLQFTDSLGDVYSLPLAGLGNGPAAAVLPGLVGGVAGTGTAGNAGDGGSATAAELNGPTAIAVDALGDYFFTDTANNEIREISAAGVITRVAGTGAAGSSGDSGAATAATLNAPMGLAVDGAGNLYIADTGNNKIRKVSGGVISTFAGTGAAGYSGDTGPAATAQLAGPEGLYLTPSGVLYVADTGNHAVRTIGVRSTAINTIAGTGKPGYTGDTTEAATATLNGPTGVAVDNNGNVYIADTGNKVIRRIAASIGSTNGMVGSGVISTYAGSGSSGLSNGAATTASFASPMALAVDTAGDLYVADTGNDAIRLVAGGQVSTVTGTGTAGFTGDGGSSSVATMNAPAGLAIDHSGNIVIADTGNDAIRDISVTASSLIYPTTNPGSTAAASVTLLNAGNVALNVAFVTVPAGFTEQPGSGANCSGTAVLVAAGASCQAEIVFAPTATQSYSGNVVITDNSQNQAGAAQTVAVSGVSAYVFTATIAAPASAVAGASETVTVSVKNPQAVYGGTIHFTSSDPKAVLPVNYTFTTADNGTHVFAGVEFGTAGVQTIAVTDTVTTTITASALVTVSGGPAAALTIVSGSGQTGGINGTYTLPLVVKVTDALGNPSTGASVTFTAPTSGADVAFAGLATYTGVSNSLGVVTTPLPTADGVTGTFSVAATLAGVPGVSFSLTNTSSVAAGFVLTSNPGSITSLPPGTSATAVVTITPVGGFNGPVTVSCGDPVASSTCAVSSMTIAPSGTGASTSFTLTVTTTGAATGQLARRQGAVYAGVLLGLLGVTMRKRRLMRGVVLAAVFGIALAGMSGCGSGTVTTTTPQEFALTVTGTSGTITSSVMIDCYVAGVP
jgi:sugar lactone lactonase YvrE